MSGGVARRPVGPELFARNGRERRAGDVRHTQARTADSRESVCRADDRASLRSVYSFASRSSVPVAISCVVVFHVCSALGAEKTGVKQCRRAALARESWRAFLEQPMTASEPTRSRRDSDPFTFLRCVYTWCPVDRFESIASFSSRP